MTFVLDLPEKPVDRFEVCFYTVDAISAIPIVEHRWIYHVNTPWTAIYPKGRQGTDFVNHWQIFRNGVFTGRSDNGFHKPWEHWNTANALVFATRAEAREEAIRHCTRHVERLQRDISSAERTLKDLQEETVR